MPPDMVWSLTPRELDRELRGAALRQKFAYRLAVVSGWVAEMCARSKRLPRLESMLKERRRLAPQTDEQQLAVAREITAMYQSNEETRPNG